MLELLKEGILVLYFSGDAKVIVGYINLKQIYAIAQLKKTEPHLSHLSLEALCSQVYLLLFNMK